MSMQLVDDTSSSADRIRDASLTDTFPTSNPYNGLIILYRSRLIYDLLKQNGKSRADMRDATSVGISVSIQNMDNPVPTSYEMQIQLALSRHHNISGSNNYI